MSLHPYAHLIYGYKITPDILSDIEDKAYEKYDYATETSPGFICGFDGIEYFGLSIGQCREKEDLIVKSNLDLDISLSTKYDVKLAMQDITNYKVNEVPKLYLACLFH